MSNWTKENDLSGYGNPVTAAWINTDTNEVIKVALSEGMHIMHGDRGDWLVIKNLYETDGPNPDYETFQTEEKAVERASEIIANRT